MDWLRESRDFVDKTQRTAPPKRAPKPEVESFDPWFASREPLGFAEPRIEAQRLGAFAADPFGDLT